MIFPLIQGQTSQ